MATKLCLPRSRREEVIMVFKHDSTAKRCIPCSDIPHLLLLDVYADVLYVLMETIDSTSLIKLVRPWPLGAAIHTMLPWK